MLLTSIFGWKIAVVYVILGLAIAVLGGTLIEKLHLENYVEDFIRTGKSVDIEQEKLKISDRLSYSFQQVKNTVKKVIL